MDKYPVLKNFHDLQDVLKTEARGRHYIAEDKERGVYPATKRDIDPERLGFLQKEGFVGKEALEAEESDKE